MDSLAEWYRYVDEVSRPARRLSDEADEEADRAAAWRPWRAADETATVPEALSADAIPDLVAALGGTQVEAMHPATVEYVDPTLHDTLRSIPTFSAPELKAPTFELRVPRLGEKPAPEPVAEPQPEPVADASAPDLSAETEIDAELDDDLSAEGEDDDGDGQLMRNWDLLSQIRSHDVAQNSYKAPFRETREELVQRLTDPPLTLEETARLLGVCPTTVRRYTNKGQLRHFRTAGNQRRFRLSDVQEFLKSRASEIEADAQADREAGRQ